MNKINTNITLDPELKKEAIKLFKNLGLDLSTAISLFLNQAVREQKIPFEITMEIPNTETIKAIEEIRELKRNKKDYKKYNSFNEILKELDIDVENNRNKKIQKGSKNSTKKKL